jgi:hypothetical protein
MEGHGIVLPHHEGLLARKKLAGKVCVMGDCQVVEPSAFW